MENITKTKISLGLVVLALILMSFFDLPQLWVFLGLALSLIIVFFVIPSREQRLKRLHRKKWKVKNAPQ